MLHEKFFFMNKKFKQFLYNLNKINISFVQILNDFISLIINFNRNLIRIFIHIFMNVFNDNYECAKLNIDVCFVLTNQIRIVQNYSTVVHKKIHDFLKI